VIEVIDESNVLYISLSTLRFLPELVDMIRLNYINNDLLSMHFIRALDGKLRYVKSLRVICYILFIQLLESIGKMYLFILYGR